MRVLRGVAHIPDSQRVAKFYFAKRTESRPLSLTFRTTQIGNHPHLCCDLY